ncbi:MAG: hypothetical protein CL869_03545 [Cytophagia bacterium]|nr:hypothetical protein [Cytophagia bacterium]|tara:strand:+ start:118 stop:540 length:423 start_codon:yes stop_codon:yes gene_type:complete
MQHEFNKYLSFHREKGGTGKIYKFEFIEHKDGFLKLKGEFPDETLNPNGTVQGGQMNSMLDDITSLLLIYESKGTVYPNSTNLHSLHHRPLFKGSVTATATVIKKGKNIATIKGEIFNEEGKLAATLLHTAVIMKSDFNM